VYVVPILFAVDPTAGLRYSILAGSFIGLVYWTFLHPGLPLYSNFDTTFPMPAPLLGLAAWTVLLLWIVRTARTAQRA
jgi:hypothetical protein